MKADALSDLRHPTAWLSDWALGGSTLSGINVSASSAMTISAYYAAVRAISEDIGKLPLITYERLDPRGKRKAREHPLFRILHSEPNNLMTSMSLRESLTKDALTWGNGYSEIIRAGGQVQALSKPIHPSRVTPGFDERGDLVYDVSMGDLSGLRSEAIVDTETIRFPQRDIFHLHGLGDGIVGFSVATLARETLGLSLAAQQFGAAFFGNGTHMSGVLKHPATLSEEALQHLRDTWSSQYQGPSNSFKPAILEEGMTWERLGIPPDDAQFLQTREFQIVEIARWFRIPPHKIEHLLNATFSNIEHQSLEYVTDTLMPWLVRWEQEISRKLFLDEQRFFAEHLVQGLLRGDQAARANYYRTLFYLGVFSPNDIRELENQNPIQSPDGELDPAGDLYFLQNNLATIGNVAAGNNGRQQMTVRGEPVDEGDEGAVALTMRGADADDFSATTHNRNGAHHD